MPEHPSILIVDDEDVVRVALTDILEMEGLAVIAASSGHEAIQILKHHTGDALRLVILDLMMPGMNGIETMHKIRAIKPSMTIVISSGYDEEEVADRFHLGQVDRTDVHFLQKPYSMAQLTTLVESCLAASG